MQSSICSFVVYINLIFGISYIKKKDKFTDNKSTSVTLISFFHYGSSAACSYEWDILLQSKCVFKLLTWLYYIK